MTKPKDAQPSQAHSSLNGSAASASGDKKSEGGSALLKNKEIKKLIDMGVQRGYLTFIEVNELLPPEVITPEAIDEVMILLGENEIEVIDATKRAKSDEDSEEEGDEAPMGAPAAEELLSARPFVRDWAVAQSFRPSFLKAMEICDLSTSFIEKQRPA